jgi:hypothetical protein
MRPAALTAIKAPPRASKDATNAFEAVIEEEMRKSTGAAASAESSSLVSSAVTATPAKKSSHRAEDEESDSSETSSGSGANQISQGQLFPAAAIPLTGSSFTTAVDAAQTGSASAQLTPSATANAPSDRRASRIGDSEAAVVSVQTRFAPSDLFSSQIAAGLAGGSIQSAEAATLSPAPARIASRAEQQSDASQQGSEAGQADLQADPSASTALGSHRVVSGGSADDAASKQNRDPSDGGAQASSAAPLASAGNPGVASAVGDSSFAPAAQQIFDGIQSSLPADASTQTPNDVQQTAADGPLKTITIALNPASLGTVTVELTLKSGKLGVKLQVEEPATAQMLRHDDGALEILLQSAGYSVQSMQVSLQSPALAGAAAQGAQSGQDFSSQTNANGGGQQQQASQRYDGQPSDKRQDQRAGYGSVQDLDGGGSLYV